MAHSIAWFHFSTPMKTCLSIALNLVTHKRPFSDNMEPSTQSCKCDGNCLYTEHNMHRLQIHKQQHALTNGLVKSQNGVNSVVMSLSLLVVCIIAVDNKAVNFISSLVKVSLLHHSLSLLYFYIKNTFVSIDYIDYTSSIDKNTYRNTYVHGCFNHKAFLH